MSNGEGKTEIPGKRFDGREGGRGKKYVTGDSMAGKGGEQVRSRRHAGAKK